MANDPVLSELGAVVLDVHNLEVMAQFWSEMLGQAPGPPRSGGTWVTVGALKERLWLVLQQVPEAKQVKNRLHLDFRVEDLDAAMDCIVEFGGSQCSSINAGGGVVMADPEGNEFCIGVFSRTRQGVRV